uniref:uncharacterized protein n=1 Tax=Myxine glutinosa TaxID=7769 RepID=UPI00358F9081
MGFPSQQRALFGVWLVKVAMQKEPQGKTDITPAQGDTLHDTGAERGVQLSNLEPNISVVFLCADAVRLTARPMQHLTAHLNRTKKTLWKTVLCSGPHYLHLRTFKRQKQFLIKLSACAAAHSSSLCKVETGMAEPWSAVTEIHWIFILRSSAQSASSLYLCLAYQGLEYAPIRLALEGVLPDVLIVFLITLCFRNVNNVVTS